MWDLLPFNISIPIGGSFDGTIPGWGSGKFVSASTGLVKNKTNTTYYALPSFKGPFFYDGFEVHLSASSLEDVTDQVDSDGHLSLTFDAAAEGVEYQLFAYYETHSNYLEQASPEHLNTTVTQSPVDSFVQNGSRAVDHFSAAGARLIANFWEHYLLDDESLQLIKEVGNYAWEDSMEIGAGALVWWTPDLLDTFRASRGYSLNKYLPLIYTNNTESNGPLASPNHYYTDEDDLGQSHVNDYWQVLTESNKIYLDTLRNWSMSTLESQFSAQVGYNLPMDMLANVPAVNGPECESLGFNHLIDAYRQFSGPANLAGKRIISSELGAIRGESYTQTMPELIWDVKRSIAGSVNNFVYHGFPYTGSYANTTWPGYTTFAYWYSAMHGPRQPSWDHYQDFMNWTARVQYVAQSGVPKIDLAFWLKRDHYYEVEQQYWPKDLEDAGYSYEYLSPDNFDLPEAYVTNGTLAPERQAFKALIVRANETLTVSGVQRLVDFANEGLPIVFSGGVPGNLTGYNATGTRFVRAALAEMNELENFHVVPFENLAVSLRSLDILPRTRACAPRTWHTYWREDTASSKTYVYVYNDAWDCGFGEGSSTGSVTFATTGVPYEYDAWTGDIKPILAYQQNASSTTIALSLAGNQSAIIGFHHAESAAPRALSFPEAVHSAASTDSSIEVTAGDAAEDVLLSNCTPVALPRPAAAMQLETWTLTVESWSPPADLGADQTKPALSNSTYNITALQPWIEISDSLRNVSGRGFYLSSFEWPPASGPADGAVLRLGAIYNTARAYINGHQLPPLDPTDAKVDLRKYLTDGKNEVEIVVSTPLGNALRKIWSDVKSSGTIALGPVPDEEGYGLLSNVSIVPYRITTIATA